MGSRLFFVQMEGAFLREMLYIFEKNLYNRERCDSSTNVQAENVFVHVWTVQAA